MKPFVISKEGLIEYYGNRVGYMKDNTAIVDEMFKKKDLEEMLRENEGIEIEWRDGIYDGLVKGHTENSVFMRKCRILQLKPEVDVRMKFIGYNDLLDKGYGEPDIKNYKTVFDGEIPTNDLEEIYVMFNKTSLPDAFTGHSLSKSDIIELYDDNGSEYFYIDSFGFVKVMDDSQNIAQENIEETNADIYPEEPEPEITETKEDYKENISQEETHENEACESENINEEVIPETDENEQETAFEPEEDNSSPTDTEEFHVETFTFTM